MAAVLPAVRRQPNRTREASAEEGATTDEEITQWVVDATEDRRLRFAVEDPDASENWPRVWIIWRANAILSSAKGHEYFLKHYLGSMTMPSRTKSPRVVDDVVWREPTRTREDGSGGRPELSDGHLRPLLRCRAALGDLVREERPEHHRSALLHPPAGAAVPPCWESKTDWDIFKALSREVSALAAPLPGSFPRYRVASRCCTILRTKWRNRM